MFNNGDFHDITMLVQTNRSNKEVIKDTFAHERQVVCLACGGKGHPKRYPLGKCEDCKGLGYLKKSRCKALSCLHCGLFYTGLIRQCGPCRPGGGGEEYTRCPDCAHWNVTYRYTSNTVLPVYRNGKRIS